MSTLRARFDVQKKLMRNDGRAGLILGRTIPRVFPIALHVIKEGLVAYCLAIQQLLEVLG